MGSSDRALTRIAKDLGVADHTLRNGVPHAEIDDGVRDELAPSEREALRQLRREVRTLRQEREILKKPQPASPKSATGSGNGMRVRRGEAGKVILTILATIDLLEVDELLQHYKFQRRIR